MVNDALPLAGSQCCEQADDFADLTGARIIDNSQRMLGAARGRCINGDEPGWRRYRQGMRIPPASLHI